jgi:hypothetical protein
LDPQLDALPIHTRDKFGLGGVLLVPAILLIPLLVAVAMVAALNRSVTWDQVLRAFPGLMVFPIAAAASIPLMLLRLRRRPALDIDESGVRVTDHGKATVFPWTDIADVTLRRSLGYRYSTEYILITRKSEPGANPEPSRITWDYGVRPSELYAIIRAGVRRWGSAADAPPQGPAEFEHPTEFGRR